MEDSVQEGDLLPKFSQFRLPVALAIVGLTLLSAGIYFTVYKSNKESIKFTHELTASGSANIVVHIAGEVVQPGVYTLPAGSRMNDLIEKAGGFTKNASQEYIDRVLNLASVLKDGVKIYIPKKEESVGIQTGNVSGVSSSLININSASLSELESLPDIGPVRAQKIVDNRPYQTLEELVEKKVIPEGIFNKIKDRITLY